MRNEEIQTVNFDFGEKEKLESKNKALTNNCRVLMNEVESQKALNESLKTLLEAKSVEFEKEFLNYRKQVILRNETDSG
jgi:DNA polymerase II large subunit